MAPDLQSLGIDRMSVEERLQLIDAIWETIPVPSPTADFPDWHREVVMDRLRTMKEDELLTWEEVRIRAGLDK